MGKKEGEGVKTQPNKFKKEYNNYNPYNKLELNKFHQLNAGEQKVGYGHQLHKRKRDLDRMIEYRKKKGLQIQQEKIEEIEQINEELNGRKKQFEKDKRKEFFIESKYKQIMNIEKRKVAKKIRWIKEQQPVDQALLKEWYKKLNYIKHYPANLKYVSLFPTSEMSEKAKEFQNKIMNDIEIQQEKKRSKLNSFEAEYKNTDKPSKKSKKDDFFLQDVEVEEQEEIEQENQDEEEEENSE